MRDQLESRNSWTLADLAAAIAGLAIALARTDPLYFNADQLNRAHLAVTGIVLGYRLTLAATIGLSAVIFLRMIREKRRPRGPEWLILLIATFTLADGVQACIWEQARNGYGIASETTRRLRGLVATLAVFLLGWLSAIGRNRIPGWCLALAVMAAAFILWWGPASLAAYELNEAVFGRTWLIPGQPGAGSDLRFWAEFVVRQLIALPSALIYAIPAASASIDLRRDRRLDGIARAALAILAAWLFIHACAMVITWPIPGRSVLWNLAWRAAHLASYALTFLIGLGLVLALRPACRERPVGVE